MNDKETDIDLDILERLQFWRAVTSILGVLTVSCLAFALVVGSLDIDTKWFGITVGVAGIILGFLDIVLAVFVLSDLRCPKCKMNFYKLLENPVRPFIPFYSSKCIHCNYEVE